MVRVVLSGTYLLRPLLLAVVDVQDFNGLFLYAIYGDIGQRSKDQLACAFFPAHAATMRHCLQRKNGLVQPENGRLGKVGIVFVEVGF